MIHEYADAGGAGRSILNVGQGKVASEAVHEECAGVGIRPVNLSTEHGERLDAAPPIAITKGGALSVTPFGPPRSPWMLERVIPNLV
jgi:hypothetical protein